MSNCYKPLVRQLSYDGDKDDLDGFLELLKETSFEGDSKDLEPILDRAKFVISHLESLLEVIETSDVQKEKDVAKLEAEHILSILLVEGGNYCFLGIQDAVNNCFEHILMNGKGCANIQASLDAMAQILRTQGFNQLYGQPATLASTFKKLPFLGSLLSNRHMFKEQKDSFGLGIGLSRTTNPDIINMIFSIFFSFFRSEFWISNQKQNIERKINRLYDKISSYDVDLKRANQSNWMMIRVAKKTNIYLQALWTALQTLLKIIHSTNLLRLSETTFQYNAKTLVECAKEHLNSQKQRYKYTEWWQAYIAKVARSDDDLYGRLEEMLENHLFLLENGNPLNPKFLAVMLIEMGFIKKPD